MIESSSIATLQDALAILRGETGDGGANARLAAYRRIMSDAGPDETADPVAGLTRALAELNNAASDQDIRAVAATWRESNPETLTPVCEVLPSDLWRNEPDPEPVLWRDVENDFVDAVLSVGEVGVLSGPGQSGKSFVAVALAIAAARAAREEHPYGATCGFRIKPGPVVLVSYEDAPKRLDQRAVVMDGKPGDLLILPDPPPIYGVDRDSGRGMALPTWATFWSKIRKASPALVIIDTAVKSAGGELLPGGSVVGYVQALEREARRGGFAVLVIAHDTKAARNAAREGEQIVDPVAGSAQWYDSARAVIHMMKMGPGDGDRLYEVVKSNYAASGVGARLRTRYVGGRRAGLELAEQLNHEGIATARAEISELQKEHKKKAKEKNARDQKAPPGGGIYVE